MDTHYCSADRILSSASPNNVGTSEHFVIVRPDNSGGTFAELVESTFDQITTDASPVLQGWDSREFSKSATVSCNEPEYSNCKGEFSENQADFAREYDENRRTSGGGLPQRTA